MKTDYTIKEANLLLQRLQMISGLKCIKFNYAIARNIDKLHIALKTAMEEISKCGKIIDQKERDEKIADLNKELGDVKAEFSPYKIKFEDIPSDILTETMNAIFNLIEGEPT